MKFTRKEFGKAHIEMMFVRGENKHSDGLGGTLGEAFIPSGGGDIFFDDEENWSPDSYISHFGNANFLAVAVHEIGHALGINHSMKTVALMAKKVNKAWIGEVRLDFDDVQAIQALYGAPGLPRTKHDDMEEVDIETGNIK